MGEGFGCGCITECLRCTAECTPPLSTPGGRHPRLVAPPRPHVSRVNRRANRGCIHAVHRRDWRRRRALVDALRVHVVRVGRIRHLGQGAELPGAALRGAPCNTPANAPRKCTSILPLCCTPPPPLPSRTPSPTSRESAATAALSCSRGRCAAGQWRNTSSLPPRLVIYCIASWRMRHFV